MKWPPTVRDLEVKWEMIAQRSFCVSSHFTLKIGHPNYTLQPDRLLLGKTWRTERYDQYLKTHWPDTIRVRPWNWSQLPNTTQYRKSRSGIDRVIGISRLNANPAGGCRCTNQHYILACKWQCLWWVSLRSNASPILFPPYSGLTLRSLPNRCVPL